MGQHSFKVCDGQETGPARRIRTRRKGRGRHQIYARLLGTWTRAAILAPGIEPGACICAVQCAERSKSYVSSSHYLAVQFKSDEYHDEFNIRGTP